MEDPVFRLGGIVRSRDEVEDFEGPLTLILQLLSKNRIEIRDISVSLILDQYLEYLEEMAEMDLEIASEFVAMASHLAYIKSKMLVAGDEEVSELEELISSLEKLRRKDEYAQIKAVSEELAEMYTRGGGLIPKPPEYLPVDREYRYSHEKGQLFSALSEALSREAGRRIDSQNEEGYRYPVRIVYSVSAKAEEIIKNLKRFGSSSLRGLIESCTGRSEIVATFIAVLELCRIGSILLSGNGDMQTVSYTGTGSDAILDEYDGDERDNGDT